jgi:hypothetical protein
MQLAWIQYQKGLKSQYYLLLILLELEDRLVGLLTNSISKDEADKIRKNQEILKKMEISDKITWFKRNIANYNKAYRELKRSKLHIDKKFDLGKM